MPPFVYDLLLLVAAATAGVFIGWWLCKASQKDIAGQSDEPTVTEQVNLIASEESRRLLSSVRQVAQTVAIKVGMHSRQVRDLSAELRRVDCDISAVLARLVEANERMESQLCDAEERLRDQASMIDMHINEARTDALTGLANRRAFDDELRKHFRKFESDGTPVSVLMLDIDYFKKLNDVHGHLAGDDVLVSVGKVLKQKVRSGDLAARYGGEEFAVIFPNLSARQARVIAERLRAAVSSCYCDFGSVPIGITASGGLSEVLRNDSIKTWMGRADEALYRSKDAGRNCGHWHDGQQLLPLIDMPVVKANEDPIAQTQVSDATVGVGQGEGVGGESIIDPETQLLNQSAFAKSLSRMLAESRRTGVTMSIVMFRIDHYNSIAQRYGVKADGIVLRSIGRLLASSVSATDPVARYNNDSFAVILPGVSLTTAVQIGERVRDAVSKLAITIADSPLQFTVSVGVGQERGNDGSAPLIDRVNSAVSLAASRGGDQIVVSDGDRFERAELEHDERLPLTGAFDFSKGVMLFEAGGPTVVG
jgi:diguanylate cyclase